MKIFFDDGLKSYSYEQLCADINAGNCYRPVLQTDDIYEYFVNSLMAIVYNKPLTLIDSTNTVNELKEIGVAGVNSEEQIEKKSIKTVDELINMLLTSETEITIFTSGTTGQPKKVVHGIKNLTRAVRRSVRHAGDVWAYAYNPTHMAGLQVFFQAFVNENTLVNVFNKDRNYVYCKIDEYQITHISATPTFYRLLLPFEKEFPSVKRITFGGEKSDKTLYENVCKIFPSAKITNIYASTEAGSLFAAKGETFQIPQDMKELFKVEEGELLIHKSLLGISDSFKYKGDFYCSGDLIEWVDEEQGLFRFVSRKNAMINVGGYKVNPEEVEEAVEHIHGVQQCKVYGRANSVLGTVLCADVKKEDASPLDVADIRKVLADNLQDFKIPRKIKFVDGFEMTRSGKLQRK